MLDELADRARQTPDAESFIKHMLTTDDLEKAWTYLSAKAYNSEEIAWTTLRGVYVHCTDERELRNVNNSLAGLLLDGAEPPLATAGLGDLVADNIGIRLDAPKIEELLQECGLRRRRLVSSQTIRQRVQQLIAAPHSGSMMVTCQAARSASMAPGRQMPYPA